MKQKLHSIYIRQKWQLTFRLRRLRLFWRHYDREFGWLWRLANGAGASLLFAGFVAIPVLSNFWQANRYQLNAATIKLVGHTDSSLADKLTYDPGTQEYQFNQAGLRQTASSIDPKAALMRAEAGTGGNNNNALYALELPQDLSKGVTYHDTNTGLSFTLTPNFASLQGQEEQGHLVYPLDQGDQAIYTLKDNGLKEDIVVPRVLTDRMTFSYTFNLPDTLEAKMIPGTGEVGIYSADPSLYGNISFGTAADQDRVMKARVNSPKNHLVFGLPAPVIKNANNATVKATAKFELNGSTLTVVADNLGLIKGSFTIDPSVVVTSTSDFTSGNNEGNIDFSTANQINRGSLTGGSVSGGWTGSSSFVAATSAFGTAVYNGYIYALGGLNSSGSDVNYVEYAPLNSSGTIGTWHYTHNSIDDGTSFVAGFTTARQAPSAVAYNGYLYIMGGSASSGNQNDVQYAKLNSNGTVGSWANTTSFTNGRSYFGAAAYGDFMYIFGGMGSGNYNDVQFAPINADGTVGTWNYTHANTNDGATFVAGFTTARYAFGVAVYNGFLYILGGTDGTNYYADVQYAPLNSNGTVGAWTTSTSFTNSRAGLAAVAYNGYLYLMGGFNTSYYNDVQYAQINANGSVGAWIATSSFTTARRYLGAAAYNNYLYMIGGLDSTNTYGDSQYAKIDPAGMPINSPSTAKTLAAARRGIQSVAYKGYLYQLGGDPEGTPSTNIYRATISDAGTIGSFSSTTAMPGGTSFFAAFAYNGYIYAVGGCSSSTCTTVDSGQRNTVYIGQIGSSGGSISSWSTSTAFTTVRHGLGAVVYNGTVYVFGGVDGTNYLSDVQYQTIGSSGSLSGTWTTASSTYNLPYTSGIAYFGSAMYGNKLYIAGGYDGTSYYNKVYYAQLDPAGGFASGWTQVNSFSTPRYGLNLVVSNGYLYVISGADATNYYADIQFAPINADGTLGSWTTGPNIYAGVYGAGAASYNGYIYVMGGNDASSLYTTVEIFTANNGGNGLLGTWTTSGNTFTTGRDSAMTVIYNGYIYVMGGEDTSLNNLSDIQYASLTASGGIGSWQTNSTGLPAAICGGSAVAYNGFLYILEGTQGALTSGSDGCETSGGTAQHTAYYTAINSNGSITNNWSSTNMVADSNSKGDNYGAAVEYNGYLYYLGGSWCSNGCDSNLTQYAKINSDGSLGTWTATTVMPASNEHLGVIAVNGYIYEIGGHNTTSNVYYASLNSSTGAIGTWVQTNPMLNGLSYGVVTAYDGYVYAMGNSDGEYAPINVNGSIGPWQNYGGGGYNGNAKRAGGGAANGYIYLVGGYDATNGYTNVLQSAPVNSIARVGHYSKLIDLGASAMLETITTHGVIPNSDGVEKVNFRTASTNGVFGALTAASSLSGTLCGSGDVSAEYVLVSITLDDSYGAIDPDINGPIANLTDFTATYHVSSSVRPAPNIRLRLGQTLQNGNLGALDTCGP